jgi:hypothetical protein
MTTAAIPSVMRSAPNAPMPFSLADELIINRVPPARERPPGEPLAAAWGHEASPGRGGRPDQNPVVAWIRFSFTAVRNTS